MIPATRHLVCLLGLVALLGRPGAADEAPPAAEIAAWVDALGAVQYSQREAATRSLIAAGPAALGPLREAIRGGDLEVSSRAIEIARSMLGGEDAPATAAAEAFLQELVESDDPTVAHLADATLGFHALGMAEAARERLEALGALINPSGFLPTGQRGTHVILNANWRGEPADMRLLTRIPGLLILSVHGVKIDDSVVPVLGRLRHTARIELYGTGATDAQVAAIREKNPDTALEVRKGGRLGVGGTPNPGPCVITQVQAGSAADKAGLQVGDVVLSLDGDAVANFQALTDIVGSHGPGEKLLIEIQRTLPDQTTEQIQRTVELDGW